MCIHLRVYGLLSIISLQTNQKYMMILLFYKWLHIRLVHMNKTLMAPT